MEEARAMAREVLKREPKFSARRFANGRGYKDLAEHERVLRALLKAGMPE